MARILQILMYVLRKEIVRFQDNVFAILDILEIIVSSLNAMELIQRLQMFALQMEHVFLLIPALATVDILEINVNY
jgi:hypothetical protein